ncbi:hypothetical protein EV421DRAFT_1808036 [Armillaria borealis]|uniref:Uncharacterized protein n=1 Tax=Armillaria borealis TaxID=47425 RepID=A0AA39MQK1_9AGAR|nr:hypothetical protein EV421DRAFT_1808036 [Armillaria borealis]
MCIILSSCLGPILAQPCCILGFSQLPPLCSSLLSHLTSSSQCVTRSTIPDLTVYPQVIALSYPPSAIISPLTNILHMRNPKRTSTALPW